MLLTIRLWGLLWPVTALLLTLCLSYLSRCHMGPVVNCKIAYC